MPDNTYPDGFRDMTEAEVSKHTQRGWERRGHQNAEWRPGDLARGLILFRTSDNAHDWTNWAYQPERLGLFLRVPKAKAELALSLRLFADMIEAGDYDTVGADA